VTNPGNQAPQPPPVAYRLLLTPLRDDVPAHQRLKRALKYLLRACRLRCDEIEEVPAIGAGQADDKGEH
jgi:hypothetical protein